MQRFWQILMYSMALCAILFPSMTDYSLIAGASADLFRKKKILRPSHLSVSPSLPPSSLPPSFPPSLPPSFPPCLPAPPCTIPNLHLTGPWNFETARNQLKMSPASKPTSNSINCSASTGTHMTGNSCQDLGVHKNAL